MAKKKTKKQAANRKVGRPPKYLPGEARAVSVILPTKLADEIDAEASRRAINRTDVIIERLTARHGRKMGAGK